MDGRSYKGDAMEPSDAAIDQVLECANRVAGTALSLPPSGDLPLQAFGFDSLSTFAFILELESLFGLVFDESLLDLKKLYSIRSVAAAVLQFEPQSDVAREEPGT
jgi:Phosphopantetheine attachment site